MKAFLRLLALSAAASTLLALASGTRAQLLITGNDEKISFDETGKTVRHAAGKDSVSIIDIREPTKPRIVANLPLMNTIIGPPVNLAITPDQHLALVANSVDWVKDGEGWKDMPDNKIYVIDLTASPPVQIATVEAGKQASGMVINRAGTLALVANRAEDSVTVLAIDGKNVKPVGTVSVATQPTPAVAAPPPAFPVAVAITPDGKRALVAKSGANRVGLLDIDGQKVSYAQVDGKNYDMATGDQWRRFVAVHTTAPWALANAVVPEMMREGWGRIVNVTTSLGTMLNAGSPTYGPSKAALEALSAIMAKDLDGTGVTVNVLVPGGITNTPMISDEAGFDRATMIQPEVMVPPLLWLVSDAAAKVTARPTHGWPRVYQREVLL